MLKKQQHLIRTVFRNWHDQNIRVFFLLTTYHASFLLCYVDVFILTQSAFLWVPLVLLFSPTCSVIHMKQKSCKGLSSKREQKLPGLLISKSNNQMIDVPSLNNSKFSDYVDRIYSIDLEIKLWYPQMWSSSYTYT